MLLVLILGAFGEWLAPLDELSPRSRGGILMDRAASAALLQFSFLNCLPRDLFRSRARTWRDRVRLAAALLFCGATTL